jgi:hypothetical protein
MKRWLSLLLLVLFVAVSAGQSSWAKSSTPIKPVLSGEAGDVDPKSA